ncbi:hypothetical protein NDU88_002372 [Pleurodeles waltl]|uniref:Uncharacterized protein n=1 Tax=Pleurodeles waltl TaxID=8319 RepID=A0AAV7W4C9_PLEWA|nr:hypothetical protein NDU88_002372 [Pleurodeles waltl]
MALSLKRSRRTKWRPRRDATAEPEVHAGDKEIAQPRYGERGSGVEDSLSTRAGTIATSRAGGEERRRGVSAARAGPVQRPTPELAAAQRGPEAPHSTPSPGGRENKRSWQAPVRSRAVDWRSCEWCGGPAANSVRAQGAEATLPSGGQVGTAEAAQRLANDREQAAGGCGPCPSPRRGTQHCN